MEFIPARNCALIDPLTEESTLPTADRNYERMGKVLKLPLVHGAECSEFAGVRVGDIVCFDEFAYRRFTYEEKDYMVVDLSQTGTQGGVWAIIHGTNEQPLQEEGIPSPIQNL